MVLPPLRQQQLDIRLDETNRCDNVEIPHPMDYTDAERLVTLRKVDDHVGPGLPHMHVCRPVLPGRQTNAYLNPSTSRTVGTGKLTYLLGYAQRNEARRWCPSTPPARYPDSL